MVPHFFLGAVDHHVCRSGEEHISETGPSVGTMAVLFLSFQSVKYADCSTSESVLQKLPSLNVLKT